ncbi:PQQ-dependent sugar dehydrogenase [Nocardioides sp. ChNu-153]|uniref:PQQ-dependent sugar dehydrogenase n=1 Tax=unclassified Nocardioides TaxID=2615069 RepID=UPI002405DBF9|nr:MULTISPECIES: PQQ-dependent sugar dehydrogenase [unclassified Nocardioides]MDF9714552.1 PQQ-dependent sugar dehydrogenase [Nocardioides sp. ChNu-99]MDN7119915.1 PQQ-dependent sugar dehydrogenase [Nocardioides sp. ChNu-153]
MRSTRRWAAAAATALVVGLIGPTTSAGAGTDDRIADPVPNDPAQAALGLVLEEHHQFPRTETVPPATDYRLQRHARINHIGDVPDGSGRQFVPDLNGPLYFLEDGEEQVYLDVRAQFPDFFSGRGMGTGFGFATFHPEFETNGVFYTVHSEQFGAIGTKPLTYPGQSREFSHSVVTEWTAEDPTADTFTGTRREVMRLGFFSQIHAIQQIDFNPTARPGSADYGLLYLAVGDGGAALGTDVPQDPATPYGKILRIDPTGTNGPNGQYGVPADNPFVGQEGWIGEIYALGMRDPHRFSWDSARPHRMYLGHIGQRAIEAVYEVRPGDNFGWSEREGRFTFDPADECALYPLPEDDEQHGYTYPVIAYDHDPPAGWPCAADSGHAIGGGYVYRGRLPHLRGKYVFGDIVDGRVYWARADQMRQERDREADLNEMQLFDTSGRRLRMTDLAGDTRVDLRFGTDSAGELYLLAKANGKVWKVVGTKIAPRVDPVSPSVADDVVARYDFEHPLAVDGTREEDAGASGTLLNLVNGGKRQRVLDPAFGGSISSLQTQQVNPAQAGNDDWRAGVYDPNGVASLDRFAGAEQITVMGWFKMSGDQYPLLNSNTPAPDDRYNAVGLAGVLSGNSDGHGVRALLELINVDGQLKLVALGRRLDDGASKTLAAHADWRTILPADTWVHLAATFDYTTGEMRLHRNGLPLRASYTATGDPWQVDGTGTSPTLPRGLKIGGSYPQNTREQNPCNCRMDELVFLDRAIRPGEVAAQYARYRISR